MNKCSSLPNVKLTMVFNGNTVISVWLAGKSVLVGGFESGMAASKRSNTTESKSLRFHSPPFSLSFDHPMIQWEEKL